MGEYKLAKRHFFIFIGLISIVLTGWCYNSNSSENATPEVEEIIETKTEYTVTVLDYEDMRDSNYYELLSLMDEVIKLAKSIKTGEISMDSSISKQTIENLYPEITEKIEYSRSNIIPNLEQNKGNENYSYFIESSENITNLLKQGIENRDYSIGRELEVNVIILNELLQVISQEREL